MENYYYQHPQEERFRDLRFVFCGREACQPLHSWGPAVRPNYILHYILQGHGIYQVGDETYHLGEKEGFLIEPGIQTFYQADAEDPWKYCWVGFDGVLAPLLLSEMGLGGSRVTFCCDRKEELNAVFSNLLQNQQYSEISDLILESELYRFFAILIGDLQLPETSGRAKNNSYVTGAVRYIQNNYFHPILVEDIAAYTGVDRSYLYTLFIREKGMSPSQYLSNFRLTRAAELLKLTDYTIESIAISCGYRDPLVFAKAFKKKYGASPLRYRKTYQLERLDS